MDSAPLPFPGMKHFPEGSELYVDHPSQARIGIHPFPSRLNVVTMLSNPLRWRSRYHNYWAFERHVRDAGAVLWTCEVAFGDRPFEITSPDNPHHLQLRSSHELWHKENALNLLMQRIPREDPETYVAWVDADVSFARPDWAQETIQQLQHYDFVQMFSMAQDLTYDIEPMEWNLHQGFMACYNELLEDPMLAAETDLSTIRDDEDHDAYFNRKRGKPGAYWHPGYAWAARMSSLEKVGMLIDWAILGSADWHMAWALIGLMNEHMVPQLSPNYRNWCLEWQERAEQHIKRNVGHVPGLLLHYFHGSKALRRYGDRWTFLIKAGFDPAVDIKRDRQGLWQLSGNNRALRDGIRAYNRMRNEDEQ